MDIVERSHARYFEPLLFHRRRIRRIAQLGQPDIKAPEVATIDLGEYCKCGGPGCDRLRLSYGGFYSRLRRSPQTGNSTRSEPMTLTAINLRRYRDYSAYLRELRRHSGNFCRDALKAGRLGYRVAQFDRGEYATEIQAIYRSLKIRSFGLMIDALLPASFTRSGYSPNQSDNDSPACDMHWELSFGVFAAGTADQIAESRANSLVGFATIRRVGNVVIYADFIGHGDHLRNGIMMLLHTEVMQWILDRSNASCRGVEILANGTLERGSDGMFFWKRKALFRPCFVDLVEEPLPSDFDSQEYLRLNPDVMESGEDPISHYRKHGRKERRLYRFAPPNDFDPATYLRLNPDVADDGWDAVTHYALFGRNENRAYRD